MGDKGHGFCYLQNDYSGLTKGREMLAIVGIFLCLTFALSGCALTGSGHSLNSSVNITTSDLSPAEEQSTYQAGLAASGGSTPYLWSVSSGTLPAGLSLTNATGQISGKPTQSGSFAFTVQVQDSSSPLKTAAHSYSITVSKPRSGLSITTTGMPNATMGTSFTLTFVASGGVSPYSWKVSSGALPGGLSLKSSTGTISGTPTQQGTSNFGITVTDSNQQTAQAAFSIVVSKSTQSSGSALSVTTGSVPPGTVGTAYSTTLSATGGTSPYSWRTIAGSLPSGLSLGASTGAITGTPSKQGTSSFTVAITDSNQNTAQAAFSIAVSPAGTKPVPGVGLDQYGGRMDINCSSAKGYFYTQKIGNHWYFCDPLGNAFVAMSVGNLVPNGNPTKDCKGVNTYPIYAAKYGDATYNWGWQTLKRMTSWGFNTVGQDSGAYVNPGQICSNCLWPGGKQPIPLPFISEMKPAENAAINVNGYISEPIKDEIGGTNSNYSSWRGGALYDMFDPKLNTYMQQSLQHNPNVTGNYPYLLALLTDDSDFFWGAGAGPDYTSGHTNANIAWVTLITSPVQTYTQATPQGSLPFVYQQTQIFSKTLAKDPTTTCSIANPCSLRDYLWQKYNGSINALNAAWGSNYTTFDSTGTQVTNEAFSTADGLHTTFIHTFAHNSISPFSVLISIGGTAEIGDCPWFRSGCVSQTANTGSLGSPKPNYVVPASSTINYTTGTVTITFDQPPARGTAITVNYIYGGWMAGGRGLMDEDGSHTSWVGTNPLCLEGADPNFPTFFSCQGKPGAGNPIPDANPALGTDLDNWVSQMAAQYFKTMHDDIKAVSNLPYFGLDVIGSFGAPAYSKFLQGAAPYLDGAYVGIHYWDPTPSPSAFESAYQYLTQYLGDMPFMTFEVISAQSDSSYYCIPGSQGPNNFTTQNARGQAWFNHVNYLLNTNSANGSIQFVGADWWSWQDFQNINQGLVSLNDNAYDGHEDTISRVLCSLPIAGLACGGETSNYGDAITQVKAGNAIWLK